MPPVRVNVRSLVRVQRPGLRGRTDTLFEPDLPQPRARNHPHGRPAEKLTANQRKVAIMSPFDSKSKLREYFENVGFIPVSIYDVHVLPYRRFDAPEAQKLRLEAKLREVNHD